MKEPVDHIIRPRLPWRPESDPGISECGYDATKIRTLTRAQFFSRLKEYGQQRTALFTCMTCMTTASRWGTWQDDPRLAIAREIEWESARWNQFARDVTDRRGHRLRDELVAIEALIAAHPHEFQQLLARQDWLARKALKGGGG